MDLFVGGTKRFFGKREPRPFPGLEGDFALPAGHAHGYIPSKKRRKGKGGVFLREGAHEVDKGKYTLDSDRHIHLHFRRKLVRERGEGGRKREIFWEKERENGAGR